MKTTTVETKINREINITRWGCGSMDLHVIETDTNTSVFSVLKPEEAEKIGLALLGGNATVITDLPEVTVQEGRGTDFTYVRANCWAYRDDKNLESLLEDAKSLLAIHKALVERRAEQEAKAAEREALAKRDKRRDELGNLFRGYGEGYGPCTIPTKKAIDHIIELEAAQA